MVNGNDTWLSVKCIFKYVIFYIVTCSLHLLRVYYEPTHDRSHVTLIAQLVEHCTGNAKVVGSNPVQNLKFFQVIFPVVSWLHSHHSFFRNVVKLRELPHEEIE